MTGGGAAITIGSRGSKLALAQTELVRAELLARQHGLRVEVQHITTRGDVVLDRPISAIGDKGLFVGEIEQALREGRIDLAVHSAKDLPAETSAELVLAAIPRRADPRDVLVSRDGVTLLELPPGANVGTSSLRRACQLLHLRPDLRIESLRGNVDTRLRKLAEGQHDAIVLAAAGLERLGAEAVPLEYLDPETMIPAVGQGALAIQARAGDEAALRLLEPLDEPATRAAVLAERAFLRTASGGCQVPIAAWASLEGERLRLLAMIGASDGRLVRGEAHGRIDAPEPLGEDLARQLMEAGGAALLAEVRGG